MDSSAQSCLTLCHPIHRSMPGLPVHLQDMDIWYMDILGAFMQPMVDSFYSAFLVFPNIFCDICNKSFSCLCYPKWLSASCNKEPCMTTNVFAVLLVNGVYLSSGMYPLKILSIIMSQQNISSFVFLKYKIQNKLKYF